jgi:hypothetical protein
MPDVPPLAGDPFDDDREDPSMSEIADDLGIAEDRLDEMFDEDGILDV